MNWLARRAGELESRIEVITSFGCSPDFSTLSLFGLYSLNYVINALAEGSSAGSHLNQLEFELCLNVILLRRVLEDVDVPGEVCFEVDKEVRQGGVVRSEVVEKVLAQRDEPLAEGFGISKTER